MDFGFCCCGCEYFTDNFNRDDGTDIGADWTEVSGDWSIASNKLAVSSANAIADCLATAGTNGRIVVVTVKAANTGDKIRVYLVRSPGGLGDPLSYYAEITWGPSGTVKLYEGATELASVALATSTTAVEVKLCGSYNEMVCWAGSATVAGTTTSTNWAGLCDVALGTGDTCTGQATFEDFSLETHFSDDPACESCCVYYPNATYHAADDWEVISGTWTITWNATTGYNLSTTDNNAVVKYKYPHPEDGSWGSVYFNSNYGRVIVNYDAPSGDQYAIDRYLDGTWLRQQLTKLPSEKLVWLTHSEAAGTMSWCWNKTTLRTSKPSGMGYGLGYYTPGETGYVALASRASGGANFQSFRMLRNIAGCVSCGYGCGITCVDLNYPNSYKVVLSGLTTPACCTGFNGTYILPAPAIADPPTGHCSGGYTIAAPAPCGTSAGGVALQLDSGGNETGIILLQFYSNYAFGSYNTQGYWSVDPGDNTVDCQGVFNVTWGAPTKVGSCDWENATVSVEGL